MTDFLTFLNDKYPFFINFAPIFQTDFHMSEDGDIEYIEHEAVVVSTMPEKNIVKVRINDADECGSCPAAALCGTANAKADNLVDIHTNHARDFRKNDIVTIRGTERMHRKAIMYATVFPCIALVAVMVAVYLVTFDQLAAALSGVGSMILFFIILWAARNKVAHEFSFEIVGKPQRAE